MPSSTSSDDDDGPPRGVASHRGGWAGDELELQRRNPSQTAAAVDLTQFRNTEVGQGYQAKHVVRQRREERVEAKVTDMRTDSATKKKESKKESKKRRRDDRERRRDKRKTSDPLEKYLSSESFRLFRKELEQYK